MKLATLKTSERDGNLIVVSRDLTRGVSASKIAPNLQSALDDWARFEQPLQELYEALNTEPELAGSFDFNPSACAAPLPRAYQWCDGSVYLSHAELVRKARGAEMPASLYHDPLIYQGASDVFLGPNDPILIADEAWGIDLEAEIAVVTDDVPMGISETAVPKHIRLLMLVNDVSLRHLIPNELAKGFGFFQSKPSTAFSPVAVTPDELGTHWRDGTIHLPLISRVNDVELGRPNAGVDMDFNFPTLISHAAKSRRLLAGTIVGSGTVSNRNFAEVGSSCLAERRMIETIEFGEPRTSFLRFGDIVEIEMLDENGKSVFGTICQQVLQYTPDA